MAAEYFTWLRTNMREMNEAAANLFREMVEHQNKVTLSLKEMGFNDHRIRERIKIDIELNDMLSRWEVYDREGRRFAMVLAAELALEEQTGQRQQRAETVMTLGGRNVK